MTHNRSIFPKIVVSALCIISLVACSSRQGESASSTEIAQRPTPTLTATPEPTASATAPASSSPPATASRRAVISADTAEQVVRLQALNAHTDRVYGLDFSSDGRLLASGSWDGTLRLWDVETWQQTRTLEHRGGGGVYWAADDTLLASGDGKIWDTASGQETHTLDSRRLFRIAFSPDGRLLAAPNPDGSITLQDVTDWQVIRTLQGHTDRVFGIAFSPDGTLLASGSGLDETDTSDFTVRIWDVASGQARHVLQGHRGDVHDVAFSPDGKYLASASTDYTVRVWDVQSGRLVHTLWHHDGLWRVAFSPDGTLLASGGVEHRVRLWDVANGKLLHTLAHPDEVMALAFSPDGALLASGGYDNVVYVWGVSRPSTAISTPAALTTERQVQGWAILAQKDDYSDVGMTDLPVDYAGITQMRQVLEDSGWEPDHIQELREFDRQALKEGLDWLAEGADEDDVVFLYVAAHGMYLKKVLAWHKFIADEWDDIANPRRLLVIDACQAADYTGAISDDPTPYLSIAAVAGDEYGWSGLEEEGLPIIGGVFTHYFADAFDDPSADTDGDGFVSVQEAARLAEEQQRAYMHDVVFAVPEFLESYHDIGAFPDRDPGFPHVVIEDTIGEPLYLALDVY